jgi:hypothetical protein
MNLLKTDSIADVISPTVARTFAALTLKSNKFPEPDLQASVISSRAFLHASSSRFCFSTFILAICDSLALVLSIERTLTCSSFCKR